MYPSYGMAEPPVPSNSNNLPRGWICKVRSSQNWELMLKIWAPELINAGHSLPIHDHWSLIRAAPLNEQWGLD